MAAGSSNDPPPAPVIKKRKRSPPKKCEHNKQVRCCKVCGGSAFCKHNKQKHYCRECGGSAYCKHNRRRAYCRECSGGAWCKHNKKKYLCRECGGGAYCEHNRVKAQCRECGGGAFCKHNKKKTQCRECGGGAFFCQHDKAKHTCAECCNCACPIEGCQKFGHRFAGPTALLRHMQSQHSGEPKAVKTSKEMKVYQALEEAGITFEYQKQIPFAACGLNSETKFAKLDFLVAKEFGYVIIEVDELQHKTYDPSCDVRRDFDVAASITLGSGHKMRTIRFNPDSYQIDGVTRTTSPKDRIKKLLEALEEEEPEGFDRLFLFFDSDSDSTLPKVAASWDKAAQEVSRIFW